MRGFTVFLGKEFTEIFSTWRIWMLPLLIIGMGVLSPVSAELLPWMMKSMAESTPGMVVEIPESTMIDSYVQYGSNLSQIIFMAVIISVAGMVASEKRSGTAILMLTKPVSRAGFVIAKVISNIALLIGATVVGTAAFWGASLIFFEPEHGDRLVGMVGLWLVLTAMMICMMALFSVVFGSQAAAAGGGLGVYLLMSILSLWRPAAEYSPAGLMSMANKLVAGEEIAAAWPVATAILVGLVACWAAATLFSRQEI